jgi:hypothetical protein
MRRTIFVVPVELAGIVQAACADAIAVQERRRLVQLLEQQRIADDVPGWLEAVERSTLSAMATRASATAAELAQDEPRLRTQLLLAEGKPYSASQSVSTRILFLLAADGRIVGGWVQRKDGEIAVRLLEDVGRDATATVESAADRLRTLLGPTRVTPHFRTPLERELSTQLGPS